MFLFLGILKEAIISSFGRRVYFRPKVYPLEKRNMKKHPEVRPRDEHVEHVEHVRKMSGSISRNSADFWTFVRK